MEGFCRGCLIKYDEPMELIQYSEKFRRLFVYSTGLQVKRNDTFKFQLCKDCFLNMKQACKFKKNCRISDRRYRNYVALKDVGDPVDFCTFLKNNDDTLTFRFPIPSGNSTPVMQKCRDDDNESTCTSIPNFITEILQDEELPPREARIIKQVIEEEADLLDDTIDSHWLQDDTSVDTDFRLDFNFSPFGTPRTVNNDQCYTPKQMLDQITFDTINTEKQTKILNNFTNAFKTNENIEELSFFVGDISGAQKAKSFKNLNQLSPFGIDQIDGMGKHHQISDSKTVEYNQNLKELCGFGLEENNSNNEMENNSIDSNPNFKDLSNFVLDEVDGIEYTESNAVKSNKSFKDLICNMNIEEVDGIGKSETNAVKSDRNQKELISHFGLGALETFGKSNSNNHQSNQNCKELCDFSLYSFNSGEKAESKIHKNVLSLKQLCDLSLDSFGSNEKPAYSINKNNESLKELYDLSLNEFDDSAKSGSNTFKTNQNAKELDLSLTDFEDIANSGSNTFKTDRNLKEMCNFVIDDRNGTQKSGSNFDLPSLSDVLERDKIDTPDFDIPKGVIDSLQSNNDTSNSSIEALLKDKPCTIDTNLEAALKNSDSKQFSLEDLLISSQVESAASTPTITNILFGGKLDTNHTNNKMEQVTVFPAESAPSTPTITNILFGGKLDTDDTNNKMEQSIVFPTELAPSTPTITNILFGGKLDTNDTNNKMEKGIVFPTKSAVSTPTITNILFGGKLDTNDTNNKMEQGIVSPAPSSASTPTITNILFGGKLDTNDTNNKMEKGIVFPPESAPSTPTITNILFGDKCDTTDTINEMEQDIVSPTASAASTPTITNILFGTTDTNIKTEQCIEPYYDIQEDIEIFEEFFQNDTKEFDVEDIIRENGGLKSGDWKKPIAVKDVDKENESKNNDIDDTDVTESKNEEIKYISHTSPNENFNLESLYCNLCKITYDTGRALSVHLTKFHKIKIVRPKTRNCNKTKVITDFSEIPSNEKFDLKNSYCNLCDKKYDTSRALSVHFSKTHNIKIEKPKPLKNRKRSENYASESNNQAIDISDTSNAKFDIEKLYCKLCKKKYKSDRALSIHFSVTHGIKIIKPRYDRKKRNDQLCNNCGIKCEDSSNFARHRKYCQLKETKGKSFKCEHCLQEFKTKYYLEKHEISHMKNIKKINKATGKEFVCTICGSILHKQSNYALHMRRHKKDYSAKCEFCDKGFYRESDLKSHVRKHTGDTPFSCTFCPKLFARRDVLLRHILTHLGEKFFECDYCGLKCIKKYDLIKHIVNKSCRKVKKDKKKKKTVRIENMDSDVKKEKVEVQVQKEEIRKVIKAKKNNNIDKKDNMNIDLTEEQEVEVKKKEVRKVKKAKQNNKADKNENMEIVEVEKEVKVIYAKGSFATLIKQFPSLESENIQEEQEEKIEVKEDVEVQKEVTVYAKGSDAIIIQQLPFLETERSN